VTSKKIEVIIRFIIVVRNHSTKMIGKGLLPLEISGDVAHLSKFQAAWPRSEEDSGCVASRPLARSVHGIVCGPCFFKRYMVNSR
jgi:hypothetical protein